MRTVHLPLKSKGHIRTYIYLRFTKNNRFPGAARRNATEIILLVASGTLASLNLLLASVFQRFCYLCVSRVIRCFGW